MDDSGCIHVRGVRDLSGVSMPEDDVQEAKEIADSVNSVHKKKRTSKKRLKVGYGDKVAPGTCVCVCVCVCECDCSAWARS
jgi:hypothetical protein